MRTACTHYGRTRRNRVVQLYTASGIETELFSNEILTDLTDAGECLLADNVNADVLAVLLDEAVKLLNNHYLIYRSGKGLDLFYGHRPDHTELEYGVLVTEYLLNVLVGGGGGDEAHLT